MQRDSSQVKPAVYSVWVKYASRAKQVLVCRTKGLLIKQPESFLSGCFPVQHCNKTQQVLVHLCVNTPTSAFFKYYFNIIYMFEG